MKARTNVWILIYLSIILITTNSFFSYAVLNDSANKLGKIIYLSIFFLLFGGGKKHCLYKRKNTGAIKCFMVFFTISSVSCLINREQSVFGTAMTIMPYFAIVSIYFLLHKYAVTEEQIVMLFTILACVFLCISFFQQFLASEYIFGSRNGSEIRMGFHRYAIFGDRLCFIPLFFYLEKWTVTKKNKYLLCVLLLFLGIFLQLERMLLFGILCGIIYYLVAKRTLSWKQWLLMGTMSFFFLSYLTSSHQEGSYTEINERNSEAGTDDIRMLSIEYYTIDFQKNVSTVLFGNGVEYRKSNYGHLVEKAEDFGFFKVDIGVFGEFNTFGLLYVLFLLYLLISNISFKRKNIDMYSAIFFVMLSSCALCGTTDLPYRLILWPFLLYLRDIQREPCVRIQNISYKN